MDILVWFGFLFSYMQRSHLKNLYMRFNLKLNRVNEQSVLLNVYIVYLQIIYIRIDICIYSIMHIIYDCAIGVVFTIVTNIGHVCIQKALQAHSR